MRFIDNFLNKITMYRLVLYYLLGLLAVAIILSIFGILPYNPILLLSSSLVFILTCFLVNIIFSRVFRAPTNVESVYITALILAFIITPATSFTDTGFLLFALWASIWAMASKFILAIKKKHIFNPAAFAVAITGIALGQSASWWVGTLALLPFVFVGGFLITRKIKRTDLVASFMLVATVGIFLSHFSSANSFKLAGQILFYSPLFFFAFIMLTEPLTTPPSKILRILYGSLVGLLFIPSLHIGSIYSTPELALVLGNIFSYLVSPKQKLILKLKAKVKVASDVYDFIFKTDKRVAFQPGQYFEWTLAHQSTDSRGSRRYFTIASSPTRKDIVMGVKFYPKGSSFKKELYALKTGDTIIASQLAGAFVLPKNKNKKLAFLAGGIGVTPFRSMTESIIDQEEKRDIVLFYSNKVVSDIAYKDLFDRSKAYGIKTIYTLTDKKAVPVPWLHKVGYIDRAMIEKEAPDWQERVFYLSGPFTAVRAFEKTLLEMGVARSHIKKDFFPGFA